MADRIVVMKSGAIQQVGTPEQVYEDPVNMFVAGFIGSPSMNFLPGRVEGGRIVLDSGASLPDAPELPGMSGPVMLGVRPEHFRVLPEGQGLPAHIRLVEPLGSDTLIHVDLAGQQIIARVSPDIRPRAGQTLHLGAMPGKAPVFDPQTEMRIRTAERKPDAAPQG